ncbi:MAG: hypothetical protein ACPLSA_06815 [Caldanaerobacter sp.]
MKYSSFRKSERMVLYFLAIFICLLFGMIFYRTFIGINEKGIEVFETFVEWLLYVFSMVIACGILLSLANAHHEVLEDRIVFRFGVFGFAHVKYAQIVQVEEIKEKDVPFLGMKIRNKICYGYFIRGDLLRIRFKEEVDFYCFLLKKKKVKEIIIFASKKEELLEEIEKRWEKC